MVEPLPISPRLIGMLHVPVNTLLASPAAWSVATDIPSPGRQDWEVLGRLPQPEPAESSHGCRCMEAVGNELVRLSFWPWLAQRVLSEAAAYLAAGFDALMLENVAAPYFVRGEQPPVIYWLMRALAERLRAEYPDTTIGIQVLAYSDDWAMDIASRCGLDFIRCESALFEGVRPEGRTPNCGNLAKLYMARQMLLAELSGDRPEPQVYVDIHKKHTVFPEELDSLEVWLDNIVFQKLEGIVITGKATGKPVEEDDLSRARDAIEKAKSESQAAVGVAWAPPLIVGSGASVDNIGTCKRYADAVIVGSSLKKNGYWECPLDEERVRRFMDAWSK